MNIQDLEDLVTNIHLLSPAEQEQVHRLIAELDARSHATQCRKDLISFYKHMIPEYIDGAHLRLMSKNFMALANGDKNRLCVNLPPRHGKSNLISTIFPAWYIGNNPNHKVMLVSHTADLAIDFGRKIRNLIASPEYQKVFPNVTLANDSKAAGSWMTNHGGVFYATGVGAALAGRGANLLLCDDIHSEQDILNGNMSALDKAYQWFAYGARTRLMPNGKVIIVQTRWSQVDLTGRLTKDSENNPEADQYEVITFPAILEVEDPETKVIKEKALWGEFFTLEELYKTKASMPTFQWNAQYMQTPTGEGAAIIKREWWQSYTYRTPPQCDFVIMTLDAAAEAHNRADFTAITVWGTFTQPHPDTGVNQTCIILLDAFKKRIEFPELKTETMRLYNEWKPDSFIVEKKSSGTPLYQELRRAGIFIQEYTPHRGSGDKIARLNAVSDIIRSKVVYVPDTRWAEELVEEIASFPFGENDDLADCTIMALMRFRQSGMITLDSDAVDDDEYTPPRVAAYY